ncbi:MAG TPA: hypothetical protein VGQ55_02535 [Pyrinomonadaceae bacterium]|jgi:hypothetical protein|nr:hypothetical protein [Pyrinomonadaceae bacterium]
MKPKEHIVDDKGTGQEKAWTLLNGLLFHGFNGRVDELAIALGRSEEEIQELLRKGGVVDDDLTMKIRGIANERNVEIN